MSKPSGEKNPASDRSATPCLPSSSTKVKIKQFSMIYPAEWLGFDQAHLWGLWACSTCFLPVFHLFFFIFSPVFLHICVTCFATYSSPVFPHVFHLFFFIFSICFSTYFSPVFQHYLHMFFHMFSPVFQYNCLFFSSYFHLFFNIFFTCFSRYF